MVSLEYRMFLAFLFFTGGIVRADEPVQEILARAPYYYIDYRINQNGSFTVDRAWQTQVLNEKALEDVKQLSFSYSTSIETAKIIEAYTLKANGKKIIVPKKSYQLTVNGGKDSNTAIFSDVTTMTLVFPQLAVGDSVVAHYRLTAKEPMFPDQFSVVENFTTHNAYDDVRLKVDAPLTLPLRYEAHALNEEQYIERKGRRILTWSWKNPMPMISKRRDYSVYNYDEMPGVFISTFKSYAEIAAAYGSRALPKAAVTDRVGQLANEIAQGQTEQEAIVHSLYDWVATHITYAGNCVGLGSVVPHDVNFILDNLMGDCKDHATLLQALLAAKGITSTQALINAGTAYKLPNIPVVSTVNHVINYIPEMNLFLDATSAATPYRMLPFADQDKPVLVVGHTGEEIKTPPQPINANAQELKAFLKISADGAIQGNTTVGLRGRFAASARERFRALSKDREKDIIQNSFKKNGAIVSGHFSKDDAQALLDTFNYSADYDVKNLLQFNKTGVLTLAPQFMSFAPISGFLHE
ncbi:MAG: DUF3857 domain-containing protein, partial [Methylomonas sp.]